LAGCSLGGTVLYQEQNLQPACTAPHTSIKHRRSDVPEPTARCVSHTGNSLVTGNPCTGLCHKQSRPCILLVIHTTLPHGWYLLSLPLFRIICPLKARLLLSAHRLSPPSTTSRPTAFFLLEPCLGKFLWFNSGPPSKRRELSSHGRERTHARHRGARGPS
jgi:hypothetical protein